MKLAEITEKSNKELDALLTQQRQALASHVIEMRTKKVPNVKHTSAIKQTIARTLTIQRQRELAQADQTDQADQKGGAN